MSTSFSGLTNQDTISDQALFCITNKDGKSRNVTWATLKENLTLEQLVTSINSGSIQSVGRIDVVNDTYSIASNSGGILSFDFANIPNQEINSIKVVKTASDLSGSLSSDVVYFIDGVINMGTTQITVPTDGLNLSGYGFETSGLISTASNYTMFKSPAGGSGNLLGKDYYISVTGANSKVYDLTSATGGEAFEFERINYISCTSLGSIDSYRQGLESGTGRFGGSPELELVGNWLGGYRITTSIVRSVDFAGSLFKAGAGFTMQSRFLTDMNVDLGASTALFDFAPSNFPNPSTVQIQGAIITRNGVFDATDSTITPNMAASDLQSQWKSNVGLSNTYEGGTATVSSQVINSVSAINTFYDVNGTFTEADLQHFDSPAEGQLRHTGNNPRDFKINLFFSVLASSSDTLTLKVVKWDNSASSFVDVVSQQKAVNNLVGGNDIAFFNVIKSVQLDQNDYVKIQIANNSSTNDFTVINESFYEISER